EFMQTLTEDERQKRFIDVQRYFGGKVASSCPLRLMLFMRAENRSAEFRAEPLPRAQAVSCLVQEYISHQRAQDKERAAEYIFDIFSDMAIQAPSYQMWLSPEAMENAGRVRALLEKHR